MNQKCRVVISAGSQAFQFDGELLDMNDEILVISCDNGEILIERKYLAFIQFLKENKKDTSKIENDVALKQKNDEALRFVKRKLKQDPLNEALEQKIVPPSQLPDDLLKEEVESVSQTEEVDEDLEARKNILMSTYGKDHPIVKAITLKQAVNAGMSNDEDFSSNFGGKTYTSPSKTVLGMKKKQ